MVKIKDYLILDSFKTKLTIFFFDWSTTYRLCDKRVLNRIYSIHLLTVRKTLLLEKCEDPRQRESRSTN